MEASRGGHNAAPSGSRKGKCGGGSSQFASSLRFQPDTLRIPTYLPTQDRRSPPCLPRHVLGFGFLHPLRFRGQRLLAGLRGFHLELDDDRREQEVKEPLPCFRLDSREICFRRDSLNAMVVPFESGRPAHRFELPIRMSGCSSCFLQVVRRQRGKASVLDWPTHREMVEALPIARRDAEHLVNRIIEVAADPGRTNARLFRLEV